MKIELDLPPAQLAQLHTVINELPLNPYATLIARLQKQLPKVRTMADPQFEALQAALSTHDTDIAIRQARVINAVLDKMLR